MADQETQGAVLAGKIAHAGNPVLRWMASNVSIETDAADNWKPSKKKSIERIDGHVAIVADELGFHGLITQIDVLNYLRRQQQTA